MSVLIIAQSGDLHANRVAAELGERGAKVTYLDTSRWPSQLHLSLAGGAGGSGAFWCDAADNEFSAVWLRRPQAVEDVAAAFHPDDQSTLRSDHSIFIEWFHQALAPKARWVNPWGVHTRASNKALQMAAAGRAGLAAPATLLSNDPAALEAFRRTRRCVSKPISRDRSMIERGRLPQTVVLPDDFSLQSQLASLQPLLLQEALDKTAEIRAHFFDGEIVACRMSPNDAPPEQIDWNLAREGPHFHFEPCTLDPAVERGLIALCRELGVVFGCIDLAETSTGDCLFIELNQMGQFLWVHERLPQLNLVARFSDLLLT